MYHDLKKIHSSVNGHLNYFQFLDSITKAFVSNCVQFLQQNMPSLFLFVWYIFRSGMMDYTVSVCSETAELFFQSCTV